MAGSDEERVSDLNCFLADSSIRAIVVLTGGYGALRLLKSVDYDQLERDPKILVGSDDASSLLLAAQGKTGVVVFHGPNLDRIESAERMQDLADALTSTEPLSPVVQGSFPENFVHTAVSGTATGPLIGGNLTAISCLAGTEFDIDISGRILFFEDRNERLDVLDRWFLNLKISGRLAEIVGFVGGKFEGCHTSGMKNMLSLEDLWSEQLQSLGIPACFGLPLGQSSECRYVPLGVRANFDASACKLEFEDGALTD